MSDKVIQGAEFEALVLRVWKGKMVGATDETIRQQLASEGISEVSVTQALTKANRSPILNGGIL
jgi:hypothetical protein